MSEKHWLVRSLRFGMDYHLYRHAEPPLRSGGCWCAHPSKGRCWIALNMKLGPDGLVYGHTLEPGGGPVDISEWFPEGGKHCNNCGWCSSGEGGVCRNPQWATCSPLTGNHVHWKPREKERSIWDMRGHWGDAEAYYSKGPGSIMVLDEYKQPSIPGAEEGGRKMPEQSKVFSVVLTEEPTLAEARELGMVGRIVFDGRVTARDEKHALVKATLEMNAKGVEKADPDKLAARVIPFGS